MNEHPGKMAWTNGGSADGPASRDGTPLPLERRRLQSYLVLMIGDIVALFAGYLAASDAHLGSVHEGALLAQLLLPVFLTIALYNAAYSLTTLDNAGRGAVRAVMALGIAGAVVLFVAFYMKSSAIFSRMVFGSGMILAGLAMAMMRMLMRRFVVWRCGRMAFNELVIDDDGPPITLPGSHRLSAARLGLVPALDDPQALDRIGQALNGTDRVIISCPPERRQAWATILKGANIEGELVDDGVAALGAHGARIASGHGLLKVSVGPLGLRARALKRMFDIAGAGLALFLLGPLLLLIALAILIEDGKPVLFVQPRVGRGNRFFPMLKFRSMRHADRDEAGSRSTRPGDSRLTRVGRLIRRTSIDELPQLVNVLRGEMSLVGPRPHALGSQAGSRLFWEIDQRYWIRHALRPGLTGLAQVRGLRGATDRETDLSRRLESDLEYLDGWSLWRDLRIIAATLRVLVHNRAF